MAAVLASLSRKSDSAVPTGSPAVHRNLTYMNVSDSLSTSRWNLFAFWRRSYTYGVNSSPPQKSPKHSSSTNTRSRLSGGDLTIEDLQPRPNCFDPLLDVEIVNDEPATGGSALRCVRPLAIDCGVTRIGDLSDRDLEQTLGMADSVLERRLRDNSVLFSPLMARQGPSGARKTRRYAKAHSLSRVLRRSTSNSPSVFGSSLEALSTRDGRVSEVPFFLLELIGQLQKPENMAEEFVLRMSASRERIDELISLVEHHFYSAQWARRRDEKQISVHEWAVLLKQFLRDLSPPLLSAEYIEAFLKVSELRQLNDQLGVLNMLIMLLPTIHRNSLLLVLRYVCAVAERAATTRMNVDDLCPILVPSLFDSLIEQAMQRSPDANSTMQVVAAARGVVRLLLVYQDVLWLVPSEMVSRLRSYNCPYRQLMPAMMKVEVVLAGSRRCSDTAHVRLHGDSVCCARLGGGEPADSARLSAQRLNARRDSFLLLNANPADLLEPDATVALQWPPRGPVAALLDFVAAQHNLRRPVMYELGGNLVGRRLSPSAQLWQLLHDNPAAKWLVEDEPTSNHS